MRSRAETTTSEAVERMLAAARHELGPELALTPDDGNAAARPSGTIVVRIPHVRGPRVALRYRSGNNAPPQEWQHGALRLLARLVSQELQKVQRDERALARRVARVRAALARGGLRMVYQPVFDLSSGAIVGVEALARFPGSPQQDPARWFAEAAAVGLGRELELTAITRAVEALRSLPTGAYLAVNVSPEVALSPALPQALSGIPPERLVLEITEHAQVDDYDILNRALRPLREAGVRLAVDDAGAGFASLRHIWRMSPDIIKVDVSLTRGVVEDLVARALSYSLRALGSSMNAVVVAEGIDSQGVVDVLRFLGVNYGQGFHLQRPGPVVRPPQPMAAVARPVSGLTPGATRVRTDPKTRSPDRTSAG